ncbi:hypothetical protein ACVWZR_003226 [Bradyrhizobium sp. i1.3.1]
MPGFGKAHAALALEVEWLGDDADREDAEFARGPGDDGGGPGAGAAAHAGGHEHHVRAGQLIADRIDDLLGCGASQFGLRAGAEACGDLGAQLDQARRLRHGKRLSVGIGDDEVDPLQPGCDHVVDGIAAGAADPEYDNARLHLVNIGHASHSVLAIAPAGRDGEGFECYPASRAVCAHDGRGQMSQSTRGLSRGRAASLATGP